MIKTEKFIEKTSTQSLDIFIPDKNVAIEYQGKQHFTPIDFFGGEIGYYNTVERDIRKKNLCNKNNLILIYFTYKKKEVPKNYNGRVFTDEIELIKYLNII